LSLGQSILIEHVFSLEEETARSRGRCCFEES